MRTFLSIVCGFLLLNSFSVKADVQPTDDTWIDGEMIQSYLEPLRESVGPPVDELIASVIGARIDNDGSDTKVSVFFTKANKVRLKRRYLANDGELYAIDVPKTLEFKMQVDGEDVLRILKLDSTKLRFLFKLPIISDAVYLRQIFANLVTGDVRIEAGILGNNILVVGKAKAMDKKFDGIDFWESIIGNLFIVAH